MQLLKIKYNNHFLWIQKFKIVYLYLTTQHREIPNNLHNEILTSEKFQIMY